MCNRPDCGLPVFLKELGIEEIIVHPAFESLFGASMPTVRRRGGKVGILPRITAIILGTQGSEVGRLVTFVHEVIHVLHPDWTETQVAADEHKLLVALNIQLPENERIN